MAVTDTWDLTAIREGGSFAAMVVVPLTIIARVAFDADDASGWAAVIALASFFAFVIGAGVAAWRQQRGTPLSHGIVTAVGVFVIVQFAFSLVRLVQGDGIRFGRIVVSLALTLGAGLLGGFLGSFLQRRGVTPYR